MTLRSDVLRKIGKVPEALRIEADEYLFTLAGLFSYVLILRESLTFYRLHESNAFQVSNGSVQALRRKQGGARGVGGVSQNKAGGTPVRRSDCEHRRRVD